MFFGVVCVCGVSVVCFEFVVWFVCMCVWCSYFVCLCVDCVCTCGVFVCVGCGVCGYVYGVLCVR